MIFITIEDKTGETKGQVLEFEDHDIVKAHAAIAEHVVQDGITKVHVDSNFFHVHKHVSVTEFGAIYRAYLTLQIVLSEAVPQRC